MATKVGAASATGEATIGAQRRQSAEPTFVFPPYYGPAVIPLGPALLWFGKLDMCVGPFRSMLPITTFQAMAQRAIQRRIPMAPLFEHAFRAFQTSGAVLNSTFEMLSPLRDRIVGGAVIGPGGPRHYATLREALHTEDYLEVSEPFEHTRIIANQFVWRCHEYFLEANQPIAQDDLEGFLRSPERLDSAIDSLAAEEVTIDGRSRIYAECLTNHFLSFGAIRAVVSDQVSLNALARVATKYFRHEFGADFLEGHVRDSQRSADGPRQHLGGVLFEALLTRVCPAINQGTAERYAIILDEESDAIESSKTKCLLAADEILESKHPRDLTEKLFADLREEVRQITELDEDAWRKSIEKVKEDPFVWGLAGGLSAGLAGVLPAIAIPAAAITLLSRIGAIGYGQRHAKQDVIRESDWCFVYELSRQKRDLRSFWRGS